MSELLNNLFYNVIDVYNDEMFEAMWNYDHNQFIKILFYIRMHRNKSCKISGRGQRKIFHTALIWLSYNKLEHLIKILPYIPHFGYWKDLLILSGTPGENSMIQLFGTQLKIDYCNLNKIIPEKVSLAAKWTPNESHSYDKKFKINKKIADYIGITRKTLRTQYLVPLRKYLHVTEQNVSAKKWTSIDYYYVPKLSLKHNYNSFLKHDPERFNNYLNNLTPNSLNNLILPTSVIAIIDKINKFTLIPNIISLFNDNSIFAIDTSGSMLGFPLTLAAALCVESSSKEWIPFSFDIDKNLDPNNKLKETISLVKISGDNYFDKVSNILNNRTKGNNMYDCINFAKSINKKHIIFLTNILLDISEIIILENIHVTFWSINTNPCNIFDFTNTTIIEGYDINIFNELKKLNIINRVIFKDLSLNLFKNEYNVPII